MHKQFVIAVLAGNGIAFLRLLDLLVAPPATPLGVPSLYIVIGAWVSFGGLFLASLVMFVGYQEEDERIWPFVRWWLLLGAVLALLANILFALVTVTLPFTPWAAWRP